MWESSTWGWRSAVLSNAAALQLCSDPGISGTLCYKGRVSLLGKNTGFQSLSAAREQCTWHGRGVPQQLPCSHLGKQLRDAGALNSSTCSLQCLRASLWMSRGGRYLLPDWTQSTALGDACSLNVDDTFQSDDLHIIHCKYPVSAHCERFTFVAASACAVTADGKGEALLQPWDCVFHMVCHQLISQQPSPFLCQWLVLPLFHLAATAVQCFLWYLPLHNCLTAIFSPYLRPASHHFPGAQLPGLAHIANASPKPSRSSSSLAGCSFWKLTVRLCSTVQM